MITGGYEEIPKWQFWVLGVYTIKLISKFNSNESRTVINVIFLLRRTMMQFKAYICEVKWEKGEILIILFDFL